MQSNAAARESSRQWVVWLETGAGIKRSVRLRSGSTPGAWPFWALLCAVLVVASAQPVRAGVNVWTNAGLEGGAINALAIDPTAPSTLYAGTNGGVCKSTDGGANWNAASN